MRDKSKLSLNSFLTNPCLSSLKPLRESHVNGLNIQIVRHDASLPGLQVLTFKMIQLFNIFPLKLC